MKLNYFFAGLTTTFISLFSIAFATLPPGSYQQTCTSCTYHNQVLTCSCPASYGATPYPTTLTVPVPAAPSCTGIANLTGILMCVNVAEQEAEEGSL